MLAIGILLRSYLCWLSGSAYLGHLQSHLDLVFHAFLYTMVHMKISSGKLGPDTGNMLHSHVSIFLPGLSRVVSCCWIDIKTIDRVANTVSGNFCSKKAISND